jgi:signal transduction histidine kinase
LARQVKQGSIATITEDRLSRIVESSDKQINRLSALIEDLLDVSRITSGKLSLNKEKFSLADMLYELINHYGPQFKDLKSAVRIEIQQDVIGYWDKVRIEQVFINLLTNASKYAPNKPIQVSLTERNNQAVLKVKDEGPGIAIQDQDRIFNRFERVSATHNVGGLGLGLYISRQIIEAHNGKIYVESDLGQGSTFVVELPKGLSRE